jgi:hypothetical protein
MTDENEVFTIGQEITITGGKWKKVIKENEKCLITSIKSTFCEVSVIDTTDADAEPKKIQCHRKFMEPGAHQVAQPTSMVAVAVAEADKEPEAQEQSDVFEMPSADDCVKVSQQQMEAIDSAGSSGVESLVQEVIDDVVEAAADFGDELASLRARVKELESDCEAYRDMMLGHQNELHFLRQQTGPTIEERKVRNEKIIQCINILCQLQQ